MSRQACFHTVTIGKNFGTICSALIVRPPEGKRTAFPTCVYHLTENECKQYAPDIEAAIAEDPETNCPICTEKISSIKPEDLFRVGCCGTFFCRKCFKEQMGAHNVRYACSACRGPVMIDRRSIEYASHSRRVEAERPGAIILSTEKISDDEIIENLRLQFENSFDTYITSIRTNLQVLKRIPDIVRQAEGLPLVKHAAEEQLRQVTQDLTKKFSLAPKIQFVTRAFS
jgi:hypothetical protein